jgi:HEAT repeat protein
MFDQDLPSRKEIEKSLKKLIPQARDADVDSRRKAVEAIYELCYRVGSQAAAAIDVLIDCLADPDEKIGESAIYGLKNCAPDSITSLIGCLRSMNSLVRMRACQSLGNIGDEAISAASLLRQLLADTNINVRCKAAWAIGLLHDTNAESISALLEMTSSPIDTDRSSALHALGNIGQALESPEILQVHKEQICLFLRDASEDVRWSACFVLESMELEAGEYISILITLLDNDPSERVQSIISSPLEKMAQQVDLHRHLPALARAIERNSKGAVDICQLLQNRGSAARDAVPTLLIALKSEDGRLAIKAAIALWKIDGQIVDALPRLESLIEEWPETVCDAITEIGSAAAPLAPSIVALLALEDWDCQWAAIDALAAIASSEPEVLLALSNALGHPSPIVKPAAAKAFARIGAAAVPTLIQILNDEKDKRSEWAADALGQIGHDAQDAIASLRERSKSKKKNVSVWSTFALAKISGDHTLVPDLLKFLRDDDPYVRQQSILSLIAIRPLTKDAIAALTIALEDDDIDVRFAAEETIKLLKTPVH